MSRALLFTALALLACRPKPEAPLRVAAAADLRLVLDELARQHQVATGQAVEVTLGSTGQLSRQLAEGAPFDVFLSADTTHAQDVARAGACDGASLTPYATGALVVVVAPGLAVPGSIEELTDERFKHLALANPEHAPYGLAAKQALERSGTWGNVQKRLVLAENVGQALQLVRTGNADAALVARALVDGPASSYLAVDARLFDPLAQTAIACGHPPAAGSRRFIDRLTSREGQAALARAGFGAPTK